MKSQTALVARKCRLNEWARMVHNSCLELYAHGVTLRITKATSETLLAKVLGVLAHVE